MSDPICVVAGVGPGNGRAFAERFAREGYRVAILARSADALKEFESRIPGTRGYACDVGDPDSVREAFGQLKSELGPAEVLVHNAGSGVFNGFLEAEAAQLEQAWRVNTLGLFLCAKAVVGDMLEAGRGAIVVSGATASLRGGAGTLAFASAKAAQRSLAQSMARQLGPRGIHVALVVIDGVIDIPVTRAMFRDRPDDFFLKPEAIADSVYHVATQDRSAWTFELDVRPFGEKW